MKNADQPIVPTHIRQIGENEYRLANERDMKYDTQFLSSYIGLTKREYFAIQIAAAATSNQDFLKNINSEVQLVAIASLEMADALLAELDKPTAKTNEPV